MTLQAYLLDTSDVFKRYALYGHTLDAIAIHLLRAMAYKNSVMQAALQKVAMSSIELSLVILIAERVLLNMKNTTKLTTGINRLDMARLYLNLVLSTVNLLKLTLLLRTAYNTIKKGISNG